MIWQMVLPREGGSDSGLSGDKNSLKLARLDLGTTGGTGDHFLYWF